MALRVVSTCIFLGFLIAVAKKFNSYERKVGYFIAVAFGWYYFSSPLFHFQRDFIILIPILASLELVKRTIISQKIEGARLIYLGFLAGVIAFIKPQYVLFLPVLGLVSIWIYRLPFSLRLGFKAIGFLAFGFLIPASLIIYWLQQYEGALDALQELSLNYLPLYGEFSQSRAGDGFTFNRVHLYSFVHLILVNLIALFEGSKEVRKRLLFFSLLTLTGWCIGRIQGIWPYYFMLYHLMYLTVVGLSFFLNPQFRGLKKWSKVPKVITMCMGVLFFYKLYVGLTFIPMLSSQGDEVRRTTLQKTEFIISYFENVSLEGTISTYHWGPSVNAALLELERPIQTKFICAAQFHHHQEEPYLIGVELEFIEEIRQNPPDYFIVENNTVIQPKKVLKKVLSQDYDLDASAHGIRIFKRKIKSRRDQ